MGKGVLQNESEVFKLTYWREFAEYSEIEHKNIC